MSTQLDPSTANADMPRSRRVVQPDPSDYKAFTTSSEPSSPPPLASPPLPPRSPLRPKAYAMSIDTRSSVLSSASGSTAYASDTTSLAGLSHAPSFGSLSTLVNARTSFRAKTPDKPLPILPPSPLPEETFDPDASFGSEPSSLGLSVSSSCPTSKRNHALLELLTSERSYAQDLCLIRDIHIPLAYGNPASLHSVPPTPPLSASSSRTHSTASDSSGSSFLDPPMSPEDVRIIFNNVADLAKFSDDFTARLESALGSVLEGGTGEDHVGQLFLEIIPELQPLYETYITRHSTAIEHLNSLPQTPALQAYLVHTSSLAQSFTHAWDLPSLLIKPVQRLLKYSLLLVAIIDETPDTHSDKEDLKNARLQMERVAHGVNEGRRRREVVKEVLMGVPFIKSGEAKAAKKKGLNVGVAASINLGRIKSIRAASFKVKEGAEANEEASRVAEMGAELRRTDAFIKQLGRDVLQWTRSMNTMMQSLHQWSESFGVVIGAKMQAHSDAYNAFVEVIRDSILRLCKDFEETVRYELLVQLRRLSDSTNDPERLLEAMRTLEPLHYGLLNFNVSKSRPPPELLEASKSYVALRAQLHAELPKYLELLDRGIQDSLNMFQRIQRMMWQRINGYWTELWEALRVDQEERGSAAQTVVIWHERFMPNLETAERLGILRKRDRDKEKLHDRRPTGRARGRSYSGPLETMSTTSTVILGSMAALDPGVVPHSARSSQSQILVASPSSTKSRPLEQKISSESMHSKHSGKSAKSSKSGRQEDCDRHYAELVYQWQTNNPVHPDPFDCVDSKRGYNQAHAPISLPMPLRKSTSHGRLLDDDPSFTATNSSRSLPPPPDAYAPEEGRGRSPRKPNFKRRLTDTLRPNTSTSTSRHRRSPSLPSMSSLSISSPRPSPAQTAFDFDPRDPALAKIPTRYDCQVVFPLKPPYCVTYRGLPFFVLELGHIYGVLIEEGHPASFPDLPLKVDDGEDCLLMVRNRRGEVGWALASFLQPVP